MVLVVAVVVDFDCLVAEACLACFPLVAAAVVLAFAAVVLVVGLSADLVDRKASVD